MSPRGAHWLVLGLCAAALFHGAVFGPWIAAAVLCAACVLSLLGWRVALDRIGHMISIVAALGLGWLLASVVSPRRPHELADVFELFRTALSAACLALAAVQLWLKNPVAGRGGAAALGLTAVLAQGGEPLGAPYVVLCLFYLGTALAALRFADPARPIWSALLLRHKRALVALLCIAAGIGSALILALPAAYGLLLEWYAADLSTDRTGFTAHVRLGEMKGMLLSDEVALRIRGPRTDHLRGAVYRRYLNGSWHEAASALPRKVAFARLGERTSTACEVSTVFANADRFFLPLGAQRIKTEQTSLMIDDTGVPRPAGDELPRRIQFEPGPPADLAVSPPGRLDLELPPALVYPLASIAKQWTKHATGPRAHLEAIGRRLRADYSYSLEFKRQPNVDPVLDFLLRERLGHCEYFASAMALLGRALDIPTRLVGGYRVAERNPLSGTWIARQRHAHAWVEAYVEGEGWSVFDPTPNAEQLAGIEETPLLGALAEVAAVWLGAAVAALGQLSAAQLAGLFAGLVAIWTALRIARRRRQMQARKKSIEIAYQEPPLAAQRLFGALAERGLTLARHEGADKLARRAADFSGLGSSAASAARLLEAYAAWRYGNRGDFAELTRDIEQWLGTLAAAPKRHARAAKSQPGDF